MKLGWRLDFQAVPEITTYNKTNYAHVQIQMCNVHIIQNP